MYNCFNNCWNFFLDVGLVHYLILSALIFCIGIYGVITRRNAITVLMSLELMFNAVNINFIAFGRQLGTPVGQVFALFIIAVAAAEAAVGLAIIINIYRNFRGVDVDKVDLLKW
ncbi:MAG: NADH-quinone oxidoreductase subunit NuoK [Chloroflexi bacterium]|nr:NADH-quinone oxidoreductase subunit NuoK [Chloroflexota bacterium]